MTHASSADEEQTRTDEASSEDASSSTLTEADATPPEDLGKNAHDVVVSLIAHQRDLIIELRSVYDRLDEVRSVEFRDLEERVRSALGDSRMFRRGSRLFVRTSGTWRSGSMSRA
ncbi:hypothetical protein [Nesterenkonia pannonica]|uniref:hypothetical protein n=1 Tax=Nesterenkonia pannonica TaxID=1548602 RepID=UPI002164B884|nr:hypothetical protein [Nesterenkonia pannonica]